MMKLEERDLEKELDFSASRSGGAGGQNVNKVATKVELKFNVAASQVLNDEEKAQVQERLANRINSEGYLQVICQTKRSQLQNKEECVKRFYELLRQAFTKQKKRKATKPTHSSVKQRLESKRRQSEKKTNRGFKGDY